MGYSKKKLKYNKTKRDQTHIDKFNGGDSNQTIGHIGGGWRLVNQTSPARALARALARARGAGPSRALA